MIISGMNRYFAKHGRWTFGLIVIVISVSFVLYFSRVSLIDLVMSRGPKTTSLLGRTVTAKDRVEEARRIALFVSLRNPAISLKSMPFSPDSKFVFSSLLQYYAATDMGVVVGDEEVGKFIRESPLLQTKGEFDFSKYNKFVKDRLKPAGFSKSDLDEAVRRALAAQKMSDEVTFNVISTKNEIRTAFDILMEKTKSKVIWFDGKEFAKTISPTEEEVKNHFESHKDAYMTSSAARAKLVEFPYKRFQAEAEKEVDFAKVKKYYETNKYLYLDVEKSKNAAAGAVYKPLEAVAEQIHNTLVERLTSKLALRAATRFSDSVYSDIEDLFYNAQDNAAAGAQSLKLFESKATDSKLQLADSGWIPRDDRKRPALAASLDKLAEDSPVSEPVKEKDRVSVAFLLEKKPSRPQTFEEAKGRAKKDFIKTRSIILAREAARNAAAEIAGALEKGTSFDKIVAKLKLKADSMPEMGAFVPPFIPNGAEILRSALATPQGAASEPVKTADGALIVYVESKKSPTDKDFEKQFPFFAPRYRQNKKQNVYRVFLTSLMAVSELDDKGK